MMHITSWGIELKLNVIHDRGLTSLIIPTLYFHDIIHAKSEAK